MKHFTLDHDGLHLVVEFDQAMALYYRARLIVEGTVVDERSVFVGKLVLRSPPPRALRVEAAVGWWGPKRATLLDDGRGQAVDFSRSR